MTYATYYATILGDRTERQALDLMEPGQSYRAAIAGWERAARAQGADLDDCGGWADRLAENLEAVELEQSSR